jgi:hypothetical protein
VKKRQWDLADCQDCQSMDSKFIEPHIQCCGSDEDEEIMVIVKAMMWNQAWAAAVAAAAACSIQ